VLDKLASLPEGALVRRLPRQPGQKEQRFMHLLAGEPNLEATAESQTPVAGSPTRVEKIEGDLIALRSEFQELKRRFDQLEAQLL
jgi:hypothetical protein